LIKKTTSWETKMNSHVSWRDNRGENVSLYFSLNPLSLSNVAYIVFYWWVNRDFRFLISLMSLFSLFEASSSSSCLSSFLTPSSQESLVLCPLSLLWSTSWSLFLSFSNRRRKMLSRDEWESMKEYFLRLEC
jgi:hypothetical protein